VYAGFAEGDERVSACVGVNDRLDADFRLVEFERTRRRNGVASRGADEIADQADVRIEKLCVARGASERLCLRGLRGGRSGRAWQHTRLGMGGGEQNLRAGSWLRGFRVAKLPQLAAQERYFSGERADLFFERFHARIFRFCGRSVAFDRHRRRVLRMSNRGEKQQSGKNSKSFHDITPGVLWA